MDENERTFLIFQVDLVCDHALWISHAQTIYYSGVLVGSIVFGQLADMYDLYLFFFFFFCVCVGGGGGGGMGTRVFCTCTFQVTKPWLENRDSIS